MKIVVEIDGGDGSATSLKYLRSLDSWFKNDWDGKFSVIGILPQLKLKEGKNKPIMPRNTAQCCPKETSEMVEMFLIPRSSVIASSPVLVFECLICDYCNGDTEVYIYTI